MLGRDYMKKVIECMELVEKYEWDRMVNAAGLIAYSISNGGVLHIFGCGHSHMLAEEAFYRAGGLVPVNPVFDTAVMLHEGAVKSSRVEKMQGYAQYILDNYEVREDEVIIIFSNSGINSLPVEMAMEAHKKGLKVVAISSLAYGRELSRHQSGQRLCDIADSVIDNHVPKGDALVQIPGTGCRMAPGSTAVGSFILNTLISEVVEELTRMKIEPPVFVSGNIEGGFESNKKYIDMYRSRIKSL